MTSPYASGATALAIVVFIASSQLTPGVTITNDSPAEPNPGPGHSAHGSAFDSGPRQKPWVMEGIGRAPLSITSLPEGRLILAQRFNVGCRIQAPSVETLSYCQSSPPG